MTLRFRCRQGGHVARRLGMACPDCGVGIVDFEREAMTSPVVARCAGCRRSIPDTALPALCEHRHPAGCAWFDDAAGTWLDEDPASAGVWVTGWFHGHIGRSHTVDGQPIGHLRDVRMCDGPPGVDDPAEQRVDMLDPVCLHFGAEAVAPREILSPLHDVRLRDWVAEEGGLVQGRLFARLRQDQAPLEPAVPLLAPSGAPVDQPDGASIPSTETPPAALGTPAPALPKSADTGSSNCPVCGPIAQLVAAILVWAVANRFTAGVYLAGVLTACLLHAAWKRWWGLPRKRDQVVAVALAALMLFAISLYGTIAYYTGNDCRIAPVVSLGLAAVGLSTASGLRACRWRTIACVAWWVVTLWWWYNTMHGCGAPPPAPVPSSPSAAAASPHAATESAESESLSPETGSVSGRPEPSAPVAPRPPESPARGPSPATSQTPTSGPAAPSGAPGPQQPQADKHAGAKPNALDGSPPNPAGVSPSPAPTPSRSEPASGTDPSATPPPKSLWDRLSGQLHDEWDAAKQAVVRHRWQLPPGLALGSGRISVTEATDTPERIADCRTKVYLPNTALFGSNESALSPEARHSLAELAPLFAAFPQRTFVITGYADMEGTDTPAGQLRNLGLSRARAEAVRDWLARAGYAPRSRMRVEGGGSGNPLTRDPSLQAYNRRVELRLACEGGK